MLIALAMYSRIPVKHADWKEENMRYSLCFVPLIGVLIGALNFLLWKAAAWLSAGNMLYACAACCVPVFVTGGIHMDGFCDTVDAVSSCRTKEKRLEILKDPHIGSFAVIDVCCYFLLLAGALSAMTRWQTVCVTGLSYVLSRCVGCIMAVTMKNARNDGSLFTFTSAASRSTTAAVLTAVLLLTVGIGAFIDPVTTLFMALGTVFAAGYAVRMAKGQFGGVTGDIIGFSIQLTELAAIVTASVGGMLWNL